MPALGRDVDVIHLLEVNGLEPAIVFSTVENYAVLSMIENRLVMRKWDCDVVKLPLSPPQIITLGLAVPNWEQASPAVRRFAEYAAKMLTKQSKESSGEVAEEV